MIAVGLIKLKTDEETKWERKFSPRDGVVDSANLSTSHLLVRSFVRLHSI